MAHERGDVSICRCNAFQAGQVDEILKIQDEFAHFKHLLASGQTESPSGFLISSHQPTDIEYFLTHGGSLYLATDSDKNIIGYVMAYSCDVFEQKHIDTRFVPDRNTGNRYERTIAAKDFVYLDQIGVTTRWHGFGVSDLLLSTLMSSARASTIITAVVERPVTNLRSKSFFLKHNFIPIGLFVTDNWKGLGPIESRVLMKTV